MDGSRLKERRKKKNLTAQQLADMVRVSRVTVSRWESNVYETDDATVRKLADVLDTSIAYLMGESANPSPIREISFGDSGTSTSAAVVQKNKNDKEMEGPNYKTKSADDLDEIIREMGAAEPEIIIRFRNMRLKWHELSDAQKKDVIEGMNYVLGRIPDDGTIFKKVGKKGRI